MIITITGKPCSGKGTVSKLLAKEKKFEYISTGDIFRTYSEKEGKNILDFQRDENVKKIDNLVDTHIQNLGKTRLKDDIIIDSRLAWHFIPKSFKVFIDVSLDIASERLVQSRRTSETINNIDEAMNMLVDRWNIENDRYQDLYNIDNLDLNNYDFIICSDNLTPEEIANQIYEEYLKFLEKK